MKLKVLFFSSALLIGAALFSYCTKETPVAEPVQTVNVDPGEAGSRGPCQVKIDAFGGCITVCGTSSSLAIPACGVSSSGQILRGSTTIPMGGSITFTINAPTSFLLSRGPCVSGQLVTALITSANQVAVPIPAGVTVQQDIDMNCNL